MRVTLDSSLKEVTYMRHESGKVCGIDDVQKRHELMKDDDEFSCSICCATSSDSTKLCSPTTASN